MGERLLPCRLPIDALNHGVTNSFSMTAHVMLSYNDFIILNILPFIPIYLSFRSISLRSTLSKAFSTSLNVANVLSFSELRVLINDEIVKICSSQDRLGLDPFCSSTINLFVSRYMLIRAFMMQENSLPTVDNKLMPLYCNGNRGSEVEPLGVGLMRACNHTKGATPVSKTLLNKTARTSQDSLFF